MTSTWSSVCTSAYAPNSSDPPVTSTSTSGAGSGSAPRMASAQPATPFTSARLHSLLLRRGRFRHALAHVLRRARREVGDLLPGERQLGAQAHAGRRLVLERGAHRVALGG